MYGLRVAAVGDGACSVFLSGGGRQPVGIIDCGSASGPGRAIDGLRRIVDLSRHPSLTIVVTHLHADHYNGLRHISTSFGRQDVFGKVVLIQARLPRHRIVTEYVARLYAMELFLGEVSGIPDLDLASELGSCCRFGLERDPKSAGDTFDLGGHALDVLWPPAELTEGVSVLVRRAVAKFDVLATKDSAIAEALDRVRRAELPMLESAPPKLGPGQRELDSAIDDVELWPADAPDGPPTLHGGPDASDHRRPAYPESLTTEVRGTADAFAEAANYMSLVVATARRDFVAWGDVPLSLARRIARAYPAPARVRATSAVALAPHHGSQGPAPSLGLPFLCVAQNGGGLYGKWTNKHTPHEASECVSTEEVGDISMTAEWRWWL